MRFVIAALCWTGFILTSPFSSAGNLVLTADLAWSQTNSAIDLPLNNPQLPAWNLAFDDSDLAWGAGAGWQINDRISFQFGYTDLGEFSSSSTIINAPQAGLDVDEYSLSTKFRFPLSGQLDATWWLGISRADFDADGTLRIPVLIATLTPQEPPNDFSNPFFAPADPGVVLPSVMEYEFDDPEDEVGVLWGFGIDWNLSDNFSLTAKYLRHNMRLLEIDTFSFGVMYSL